MKFLVVVVLLMHFFFKISIESRLHINHIIDSSIPIIKVRAQLVKLGLRQGVYGKEAYPLDWSTYQSSFTQLLKTRHFLSTNYAKRVTEYNTSDGVLLKT